MIFLQLKLKNILPTSNEKAKLSLGDLFIKRKGVVVDVGGEDLGDDVVVPLLFSKDGQGTILGELKKIYEKQESLSKKLKDLKSNMDKKFDIFFCLIMLLDKFRIGGNKVCYSIFSIIFV